MLDFSQKVKIYNLFSCLNKYLLKFNGDIFLGHPCIFGKHQGPRKIANWGGHFSYIRVLRYQFRLKSIVFTLCEQ